jgi:hypothetical protein
MVNADRAAATARLIHHRQTNRAMRMKLLAYELDRFILFAARRSRAHDFLDAHVGGTTI